METGEALVFNGQPGGRPLEEALPYLQDPDTLLIAHNGIGYDLPVLKKLLGWEVPWHRVLDTLVLSRLVWGDLFTRDINFRGSTAGKNFPGNLMGSHSLEAWGYRLGEHKGDYKGDPLKIAAYQGPLFGMSEEDAKKRAYKERWSEWNQAMEDYCVQDTQVTLKLYQKILSKKLPEQTIRIEMQVAHIIGRQERYGFLFDEKAGAKLYATLSQQRTELEAEVKETFAPRYLKAGKVMTPKRGNKTLGYEAGAPFTPVKLTEFNPASREHIAYWLTAMYGWEPEEFTPDGRAKVDDDVISALPYREASPLKKYFLVNKTIGQLAEGNKAWLKLVKKDGRLHGRVDTVGAITGRMTHKDPNLGQVPSGKALHGRECRSLFIVPEGKTLVGCDADALELRCLAGYMANYDLGAYVLTVLEGDKDQGTDMHSINARALGMDPKEEIHPKLSGREVAKTWFYAFIYGAGNAKLGYIRTLKKKGVSRIGKESKEAFLRNLPAMGKLAERVKQKAAQQGFLNGLDGRALKIRSDHAALNTLLQGAGALFMKVALCILDDAIQAQGFIPGVHYEFVANVHDEFQIEVDDDKAEIVGKLAVQSIQEAGRRFQFKCPLDGQFTTGRSWAETH